MSPNLILLTSVKTIQLHNACVRLDLLRSISINILHSLSADADAFFVTDVAAPTIISAANRLAIILRIIIILQQRIPNRDIASHSSHISWIISCTTSSTIDIAILLVLSVKSNWYAFCCSAYCIISVLNCKCSYHLILFPDLLTFQ